MTDQTNRGPVVIDTDVYSARLTPNSSMAERYGAHLRGWGAARLLRLDAEIARTEIVHTGKNLIRT